MNAVNESALQVVMPKKNLSIFDNCPRGFEDELVRLMDEYALAAIAANKEQVPKPKSITHQTAARKLVQGLHSQGWVITGRPGGSWKKALEPLLSYVNKGKP